MLSQDDTHVHNKFPKPDKLLSPFHAVALEMEQGVAAGHFTGWSCATPESLLSCFFADEASPSSVGLAEPEGPFHPAFDLGSLTKPLFLNAILRKAIAHSPALLLSPVLSFLKPRSAVGVLLQQRLEEHPHLRLIDFLDHTSGVRSWFWYGRGQWALKNNPEASSLKREPAHLDIAPLELFKEAFCSTLVNASFEKIHPYPCATVYSDPNYFLLARILEHSSFLPDFSWQNELEELNKNLNSGFFHASLTPHKSQQAIPYFPYVSTQNTESGSLEHSENTFGPAFDTNVNILSTLKSSGQNSQSSGGSKNGGLVSGQAGLFGSVADVLAGVQNLMSSQLAWSLLPDFQSYWKNAPGNSRFVWGLDTPSSEKTLAGVKTWPLPADSRVFGHLGFTGTSFWFSLNEHSQPEAHILLTNRTASRTCYGSTPVPRICVQTHFTTGHSTYFVTSKKGSWQEISEDSAFELMQTHRNSTRHIWNQNLIRSFPDINAFRQKAGRSLWKL